VRLTYPTKRRNDQRNRGYWLFDVNAAREFNLKGGLNLQLRAEIFNLFNKDWLQIFENRDEINVQNREFGRSFQLSTRLAF
jgi:outer membrane receptor protein involved in Fe transport